MALEAHPGAALHIEHDAVAVVARRSYLVLACFSGQFQEVAVVGLVEPGQAIAHLIGVDATAGDMLHVSCLA